MFILEVMCVVVFFVHNPLANKPRFYVFSYANGANYRGEYAQLVSSRPMSTDPEKKANKFSIGKENTLFNWLLTIYI